MAENAGAEGIEERPRRTSRSLFDATGSLLLAGLSLVRTRLGFCPAWLLIVANDCFYYAELNGWTFLTASGEGNWAQDHFEFLISNMLGANVPAVPGTLGSSNPSSSTTWGDLSWSSLARHGWPSKRMGG